LSDTPSLPVSAVEKDHKLDAAAEKSQEALSQHRWHWTLDESNAKRVSVNSYAAAVGRNEAGIRRMVNGYAAYMKSGSDGSVRTRSLADEIEVAKLGATRQIAASALATATGRTVGSVARHSRGEIKATVQAAEDAAERRGTTVEDEIPRVAASHAKAKAQEAKTKEDRKRRFGIVTTSIEGHILVAKRRLTSALTECGDIDFPDEDQEMLRDLIARTTAVLELIDLRLGGVKDINWEEELAKLGDSV
jgi:hypothetical protein